MQATSDLFESLTERELLGVEELASKCLAQGAVLADVRGFTEEEMEAVYNFAHNAYLQGKYTEARQLFQFLAENDHTENRFWMGLAASCQMSGGYQQAVTAYGMAAFLDATNPRPALHACECFLAMEEWGNGRKALDAVNFICSTQGAAQYTDVLQRAGKLSAIIEKTGPAGIDRVAGRPHPNPSKP